MPDVEITLTVGIRCTDGRYTVTIDGVETVAGTELYEATTVLHTTLEDKWKYARVQAIQGATDD